MKTTKKIVALFLAVLMVFSAISVSMISFAATKKVTKIALSKTSATIYATKTLTLTAKVTPSNATNKKVTWSTSNKSVATVSSKGVVTGKKAGTATITVKTADGGKKATCKVTVKKLVKITSLKLNYTAKTVNVGSSLKLKATAKPTNASILTYKWTSSNTKVATVASNGTVKGIKAGTATITCAATDGSGKKATCKITVKNVPVSSITLNKTSITVYPAKSYTLKAMVAPTNATTPAVKWTSSDTTAATVSSTGVVKGVKAGKTATITCAATDGSGKKATCKVTVGTYAKDITLSSAVDKDSSWYLNKTGKVTATFTPSNTTNKKVTWTSSEPECVTVDANGNVTIIATSKKVKGALGITSTKKVSSAVITATAADGSGVKGTYTVNIKDFKALNKLTVSEDLPEVMYIGQSVAFKVATDPADASERGVKFASSNTKVATVDANGNVKGVGEGTAVITATSTYDATKKVSSSAVKVEPVKINANITATTKKDFYAAGDEATIVCYTEPSGALIKLGTKYESSNTNVAVVVPYKDNPQLATIQFVGTGKAKVRALTANGEAASEWIEVEARELKVSKSYFENVKKDDFFEIEANLYNGAKISATDERLVDVKALGVYADYVTVVPDENNLNKFRIFIDKELPDTGATITFKAAYEKVNITAKVSLNKKAYKLPSGTKAQLLTTFKNYSVSAKTIEKADNVKTVNYSNTTVDNSKSTTDVTVSSPLTLGIPVSLGEFLEKAGSVAGDDEDLLGEMSPESMIKDLFSESSEDFSTVGKAAFPNAITVDAADVKSITVIDNGGSTYQMKLVLNDQTANVALDNVAGSSYGKTMKVIDKAFMEGYKDQLDISGSEELGGDASTSLNYGTINQKYTGGYVIYTIDKLTNKVVESEYHYKSDMKVDKAVFNMKASLADTGLGNITLSVKITGYFTMQVETTSKYTSMKY